MDIRGAVTIAVAGYALAGPARSVTRFGAFIGIIARPVQKVMEKCISFWIAIFSRIDTRRAGASGLNDVGIEMET